MTRLISSNQKAELLLNEDVIVAFGGKLHLNGILWGNLTVESGGKAIIDGIVKGTVKIERGAAFDLDGIVWGAIENFGVDTVIKDFVSELREGEGARTDTSRGYVRKRESMREALALPYIA